MKSKTHNRAFTLLEMLLVIAIIAILAGIVIVAINPGRQLAQSRNAQRANDIRSLHSAVQQYYIDNNEWPAGLDQTETDGTILEVCREGQSDSSCLDLESALVPTYLSAIPEDPQVTASSTLYRIGINPTSQTPNVLAVNSTEYDLEEVEIVTPCGDPTDERCWSDVSGSRLSWGPEDVLTSVQSGIDGLANTLSLISFDGSYPAAEYCYDLDEGGYTDWYLPANGEIIKGWNNLGTLVFDVNHSTFNNYPINWTSTETGNQQQAYVLHGNLDSANVAANKSAAYYVLCTR